MKLTDYITEHYDGNKAAFARSMDTLPQTVTKWINSDWIVIDGQLYSPRRELLEPSDAGEKTYTKSEMLELINRGIKGGL